MEEIVIHHLKTQIKAAEPALNRLENSLELPLQTKSIFENTPHLGTFADRCRDVATYITEVLFKNKEDLKKLKGFFLNKTLETPALQEEAQEFITENVNSAMISVCICKYLCNLEKTKLVNCNKSNDYPDLIRSDFLYTSLPVNGNSGSPTIKGGRPINVPDGLEIKTSRNNSITLDCHGPKMGIFLYCPWMHNNRGKIELTDAYLAFLEFEDFKKGNINSKHTTPKWNIKNPSKFISIYTGQCFSKDTTNTDDYSIFSYKKAIF